MLARPSLRRPGLPRQTFVGILSAMIAVLLSVVPEAMANRPDRVMGPEGLLLPAYHEGVDPEAAPIQPWDIDPAVPEAAAKIAALKRFETLRWSQYPTDNELAMDALYYDIDIAIDYTAHTVAGTVLARLRVDVPAIAQADLDLAEGMTVYGVTQNGAPVAFTHIDEIITVELDGTYYQDDIVEIEVSYGGTPPASYGAFGFDSHDNETLVWTLSEPFGARSWWPCDDWSDDKADSVDIRVTVPSGQIVASNGILREVVTGPETDTYWWHESYPIATYLVSLAIYPYTVFSDYYHYTETDSMPIEFYIYPSDYQATLEMNLLTKDMIALFADVYGEYPFIAEKYGHAQFNWSGAMEHQTCTSMGYWAFNEATTAHELAHQWWGDLVTCATFHDIWLNEGFARYSEAIWLEHRYGEAGFWGKMNSTRYYGEGTIYVPDLSNWNRIFDVNLSYNKASWVVHMLRGVLGEGTFWSFLQTYREEFAYDSATTEQFQAVAEAVSGLDLEAFFQQWIYGEYYPTYAYEWESVENAGQHEVHLAIDQIQTNTGLFTMPIEIEVTLAGGAVETFRIDNALAHEEYQFVVSAPATTVALDPHDWILKRVVEPVSNPTFSEGILLVNGVHWDTYGNEITSAYEDRAFWGDLEISFWDVFSEPAGGYPSTLPEPLGSGRVPSGVLGQFATVIWIGNDYNGDIDAWINTSILPYLEAGGNVLLMARQGQNFLDASLRDYLGITLTNRTTLYMCETAHPELENITRIGTQNYCRTFSTALTQETSTLLYIDSYWTPDEGIGVLRVPEEGGTHNPGGGRFAFLSGRPYRWDHADLAAAVETIIGSLMIHPAAVPGDNPPATSLRLHLPSPAYQRAALHLRLPESAVLDLRLYDAQGRMLRTLHRGELPAGTHTLLWDGTTGGGAPAAAGIYYVRLTGAAEEITRPVLLLR